MKNTIKTLILAGALAAASFTGASAMTISHDGLAVSAPIEHVRFGCGLGWHPNPWGRCVPNGRRVFVRRHYRRW
jgi:hypothetical protein